MVEQGSLFPGRTGIPQADPAYAGVLGDGREGIGGCGALAAGGGADVAAYVSVVVDIPARALSEPFAYAVPTCLAGECQVGATVLVPFARRFEAGYIVARASSLSRLAGASDVDAARVKCVIQVLAPPSFSSTSAELAIWMSREYVAPLADCLRLFLSPGGVGKVVRREDGTYAIEPPRITPSTERWVCLTEQGRAFVPPAHAVRQRQLIEALSYGPITTRELNAIYGDMAQPVRALQKRGIAIVEERRSWRGGDGSTTLSSAASAPPDRLTAGQRCALDAIDEAGRRGAADVVLVDGVTGSGKTEVYLASIERVLSQGKSACVLVPEISLTAQTVGRFRSRFGRAVAVFHSRLSAGERLDQWDLVHSGEARVVVGARSALFCPLRDLGLIVIDEEHEQSYKQGSSPRYHAREVAAQMARLHGCPLVLGSATPSAEALVRCEAGGHCGQRWTRVQMPERPGAAALPDIIIADLRREFAAGSRSMFSKPLHDALMEVVRRREKAVLLHNRRGFANFLMCRECGCVPTCRHCSTALTYHERTHTLECHTCGAVYHVRPYPAPGSACPQCGSRYLAKMGLGTQQVEDALRALLPDDVEIIRMDADTTRAKGAHQRLLEQFDAADCAVLLGTQMIAKGLDFPEVTLACVVNADYALKMPDFRAGERAYDLLEQVAGRAGRGEDPGKVVIQTYLPHDPVIRAVAAHDRSIFTEHDLAQRRDAAYPPYVRLVNILVWGRDERAARSHISRIAVELRALMAPDESVGSHPVPPFPAIPDPQIALRGCEASSGQALTGRPVIMGPAPCVIERAKDRYRFHVIVKVPLGHDVSGAISQALERVGARAGVSVAVDVDAYDLM